MRKAGIVTCSMRRSLQAHNVGRALRTPPRLALALAAILGGLLWLLLRPAPPEPLYEGKPLTWWLEWWSTNRLGPWTSADGPPFRIADVSQCGPALSNMGPAAIPVLTACLREHDSAWRRGYGSVQSRLPSFLRRVIPEVGSDGWIDSRAAAGYFGYLGTNAIPHLIELIEDRNLAVRQAAALALEPFAGTALSTQETARVFGKLLEREKDDLVVETSVGALGRIGPAASNSVPGLVRVLEACLTDTNKPWSWRDKVISSGADALGAVGPPAAAAVPALTNLLSSAGFTRDLQVAIAIWRISSNSVQTLPVLLRYCEFGYVGAMDALGEIGPPAKAGVPFLAARSKSTDPIQRRSAVTALTRIDPVTAAEVESKQPVTSR